MEVTIGPATSFAAACILLVLLLVAAQLCLTINSVQVSLRRRYWPRRAAQFLPWVVVPSLTGGAARRDGVVGARYPWVPLLVGVLLTAGCGAGLAWLPFAPAERRDAWRWLAGPSRHYSRRVAPRSSRSRRPRSRRSTSSSSRPRCSVLAPERLRALIGAHNAIVDASARVDAQPVAYADVCERRGGARVGASCALSSPLSLLLPPTAFDDRLHVAADQRSWVPREQPTGATSQLSYAELTAELARTAAQRGEGSAEAEAERWQIRRSLPGLHEGAPSLLAPPPASAARMVFPLRPPPRAAPPTDVDEWGVPDPEAEAAAAAAAAAAEEAAASAVATAAAWERAALVALRAATPPAPPPPTPGLAAPPPGPPTAGITALVDSGAVRAREAVGGAVGGGAALLGWLLLVGVPAVAYLLGSLTPLLRRPLRHAAVLYVGSAAGTAAALGLLGWGASGGGGVGGDGMPPLAPLTPVLLHALVFCIASQAAVVVAASLEAAWRASPDEPTEMKLGHALELAAPPLAAAAAVGVAAIGGGCVARGGAALGSAPLLQHATAAALCLCAGVGVALTTFWASVVYELRPPTVRILMRRTRLPPDADAATRLHLAARRGSPSKPPSSSSSSSSPPPPPRTPPPASPPPPTAPTITWTAGSSTASTLPPTTPRRALRCSRRPCTSTLPPPTSTSPRTAPPCSPPTMHCAAPPPSSASDRGSALGSTPSSRATAAGSPRAPPPAPSPPFCCGSLSGPPTCRRAAAATRRRPPGRCRRGGGT